MVVVVVVRWVVRSCRSRSPRRRRGPCAPPPGTASAPAPRRRSTWSSEPRSSSSWPPYSPRACGRRDCVVATVVFVDDDDVRVFTPLQENTSTAARERRLTKTCDGEPCDQGDGGHERHEHDQCRHFFLFYLRRRRGAVCSSSCYYNRRQRKEIEIQRGVGGGMCMCVCVCVCTTTKPHTKPTTSDINFYILGCGDVLRSGLGYRCFRRGYYYPSSVRARITDNRRHD